MSKEIPLTAGDEIIKNSSKQESATIGEQYSNQNLQESKKCFLS